MSNAATPSTRPLWALIVVLLGLNAALLGWLWLQPGAAARPPQPAHPAVGAAFLPDTLQFSAAQLQQYQALRATYFRQVKPLTQACRQQCQRYFLLVDSATLSDAQLTRAARAALDHKVAVDVCTVRHLQQVAAICTPAQRQLLRRVLAPDCSEQGCVQPPALTAVCTPPVLPMLGMQLCK